MTVGTIAGAIGKGLVAGAAGTVAMTISSTLEMKARGREQSTAPAEAAERVLGVEPKGESEETRLNTLVHFGYGTGWGIPRGLLGLVMSGPMATATHFLAVWGTALGMLPGLGVAPPPTQWGAKEVAVDAWHHAVYAVVTGLVFDLLDRDRS
ncbi:MAG TPA: hypothetical protein VG709_02480 [Actinomycetota bacterium]|nr:hypothetical protein [Actinomycetota bacterium]